LNDLVVCSRSGDVGDDAEFEVASTVGEVGEDCGGFGLRAYDGADGEALGEELGEDVGADEAVCACEEDAERHCCFWEGLSEIEGSGEWQLSIKLEFAISMLIMSI